MSSLCGIASQAKGSHGVWLIMVVACPYYIHYVVVARQTNKQTPTKNAMYTTYSRRQVQGPPSLTSVSSIGDG
ncbi:hypothetical protein GE21DRAFT_1288870 [Neurospora crassa]|nr:hypothetical protein GE21DRAFT_1288870 [Neurospora crassa]